MRDRALEGAVAGCLLHASNSRQMEAAVRARGTTDEQLTTLRDGMADPYTLAWCYPMVAAIGRRATA